MLRKDYTSEEIAVMANAFMSDLALASPHIIGKTLESIKGTYFTSEGTTVTEDAGIFGLNDTGYSSFNDLWVKTPLREITTTADACASLHSAMPELHFASFTMGEDDKVISAVVDMHSDNGIDLFLVPGLLKYVTVPVFTTYHSPIGDSNTIGIYEREAAVLVDAARMSPTGYYFINAGCWYTHANPPSSMYMRNSRCKSFNLTVRGTGNIQCSTGGNATVFGCCERPGMVRVKYAATPYEQVIYDTATTEYGGTEPSPTQAQLLTLRTGELATGGDNVSIEEVLAITDKRYISI